MDLKILCLYELKLEEQCTRYLFRGNLLQYDILRNRYPAV